MRLIRTPCIAMLTDALDFEDDAGNGNAMRGCLIPMKDLAQTMIDDQGCTKARQTINNGPYA